jgi:hypothetical protein
VVGFLLYWRPQAPGRHSGIASKTDYWLEECDRLATTELEQKLMVRIKRGYLHFFADFATVTWPSPRLGESTHLAT